MVLPSWPCMKARRHAITGILHVNEGIQFTISLILQGTKKPVRWNNSVREHRVAHRPDDALVT